METATNGQFREFIGKLLVNGNDEKVTLIDKTKIQNAINSLSSQNDDKVINNLIRFINNGCNVQMIGNHEIDTDQNPELPFDGAEIEFHEKSGKVLLDFSKMNFYLSEEQKTGSIVGTKLREQLKGKKVLNACILDYLFANPHLIPEEWKQNSKGNTRFIFFWGTIFRDSYGRLYVRYLYFNDGKWQTDNNWLNNNFNDNNPAVVSESLFFLPQLFFEGVLFCELPTPATEHFTDSIHFFCK